MTHLRIEQNNIQENVSSAVIDKLYLLATSGDLDLSSNLAGNLHTTATYLEYIDGIRAVFPDLTISTDNIYILFQDPEVLRVLLANNIGDGTGVTLTQAASANIGSIFKNNTTITSFDELRLFTSMTSFDLSAFEGCSSLTSVTLNSVIASIPVLCFYGCSSLASISGLSNVTTLGTNSLRGCSSLTTHDLDFSKIISYGQSCLYDTPITIPAADLLHVLTVSQYGLNSNKITGTSLVLDSIISIGVNSFANNNTLTSLTISSLLLLNIGYTAFEDCTNLTTIDLSGSNITALNRGIFSGCNVTIAKLPLTLRRFGEASTANALGNKRLTEIRGLDNITELYNSYLTNISHAIYHGSLQQSKVFISRCSSDSGESSQHSYLNLYYLPSFKKSPYVLYYNYYGRIDNTLAGYRVNDSNSDTTINLIYFKELENINHFMFYGARFKSFVINKNTPPTVDDTGISFDGNFSGVANYSQWSTSIFGTIPTSGNNAMIIYVPDAAVSTYQADSNYNSYTIRGINEVDPNTNQPYLTRYATNDLWEAAGKPANGLIEEYM